VLYDLSVKAGVKFDAHYNLTGIDPPELVYFIRNHYPDVDTIKPLMTMWEGMQTHGFPRRQSRWCCEVLKEFSGSGRFQLTGISWAESYRRKKRSMLEVSHTDKTKLFLHPFIDWSDSEVWEYILTNKISYCSLYDEGFKRLGCVLCPFTTRKQTLKDMERYPKIAGAWYRAGKRYYENSGHKGLKRWATYDEMWEWWIGRGEK